MASNRSERLRFSSPVPPPPEINRRPGLQVGERGMAVGQRRGDVGMVGGKPAEQLGEGKVGQRAVPEVEAVPDERAPAALGGPVDELAQQPGLPDAGVSGQQNGTRPRLSGQAEDVGQLGELAVASEDRALSPGRCCHVVHHCGRHRRSARGYRGPVTG